MMRPLLLVLAVLNAAASMGQVVYGNEWIDHDRQYWRFDVYRDGVFRIDSATLANAGFPIGSVDPQDLMLFAREQEVPIYVKGEEDGVLNAGDFIEFQGRKNDGWIDKRMYALPEYDPNPYFSSYNDTIHYFLTWDSSVPVQHIHSYTNTDYASYQQRPWVYAEALRVFSDYYWLGYIHPGWLNAGIYVTSGMMQESEGWGGPFLRYDLGLTTQDVLVSTPRAYTGVGAPNAHVTATAAAQDAAGGGWNIDHHLQLLHGPGFNTLGVDTFFSGARTVRGSFEVPPSELVNNLTIRYQTPHDIVPLPQGNPDYWDWQVLSNVYVRYARTLSIDGAGPLEFWIPDQPGEDIARLAIGAFTGTPVVYAWGDTIRRIETSFGFGEWDVLVPADPASDETHAYVFARESISNITSLHAVNGTGTFTDFMALEADSAMLIVAHSSLMNGAQAYANFRSVESQDEHRYNTVVADVDELYDQFGGGVPKHAQGIRGYCKFLLDNWSTAPRALFLLGKSVNTWAVYGGESNSIRPPSGGSYERCLIPSFGYPSCDQCFTTGLNFDYRHMDIPVGRLSANTNQDVLDYLDKVRELENQPPGLWMKNIIHFAGGFGQQVEQLANYLNGFAVLAEDTCFGGNVTLFKKTTSDVIEAAPADSVRHLIEDPDEGVTLMTFFAHAFSSSFDITIDQPENYDWQGKYPMVIGNSCYIGNIHLNGQFSTSEQWVDIPHAGPVAFLASVEQGITGYLANYTQEFYKSFSQLHYGGSIGEHMQYAGFQSQMTTSLESAYTAHTFALQGDPTLTLNAQPAPDYAVSAEEIFFEPAIVTADVDSFTVKVVISNIGKAVNRTFNVELKRTNPSLPGGEQHYFTTMSNVLFRDTAYFSVPTLGFSGGQGVNQFEVRVDLEPDQVPELDDAGNNVAFTTLFITSGDLVPAYPYDFAIVPDPTPMLKASTGDPLAPPRAYVFQIDTTDLFNSPILETTTITAPGGVVSWQPQSIYALNSVADSTVFFWRCSIDSVGNEGNYNWYERSFQYITGKHGWGQAHYFQFKNDAYSGVTYDRPERDFDFYQGQRQIRSEVLGNVGNQSTNWSIDLVAQDYGGCGTAAWHVGVIDPVTFVPWGTYGADQFGEYNLDHQFGNGNNGPACRTRVEYNFNFHTDVPSELAGLRNMIDTAVPDGYHLIFFTWLYLDKDGMEANDPQLISTLQGLALPGALDFSALPDSVPYIFYVRKGHPESFRDTIGTSIGSEINFSTWVDGVRDQGIITTMNAGPATAWHGLYWNELPVNSQDSTRIKVLGIPPGEGSPPVELLDFPSAQDSVPDLGTLVDAAQYPRLRIQGYFSDIGAVDPKPSQMVRWQLLDSPVPECAIHPPLGYYNALDGWAAGQDAAVAVAIQNISEFDMDSLLVGAWIIDAGNTRRLVHYKLNAALPSGAFLVDTVHFNTLEFGGHNTMIIEANPVDTATGVYAQLEQYHFNNIAQWRFDVAVDRENPLLDVTFDGMHILDGDIVSAKPEITITLDDENPLLLMDSPADTANFKVFLTRPGTSVERVFFVNGAGEEILQFVPTSGPENIAHINYRPTFPADGKYMLTVQASDLSANVSGDHDYKVNFEVINRSTITEVLNYPNPFTTSTRFVFTVTGSEPPSYMKVQIMTVTGKVVREVTMTELGPIRVGRNITEFAWDGTDQFGDRLARGVYLYRVIAQLNGEDIEERGTNASQYFTKGFGKMYLLR
ncbi:MAG: C25 family cysteine peptidase [Flavobacteriales bacterium]